MMSFELAHRDEPLTLRKRNTLKAGFACSAAVVLAALSLHTFNRESDHATEAPELQPFAFAEANLLIPEDEIFAGGPPKDGIPALTNPRILSAHQAGYLRDGDRVIGVILGGEARAYPLRILNWHEIVNDKVGQTPIAVTYCPLCDSAVVFDRSVGGQTREFGVSGRLYNSNVLMYDRQSAPEQESLWSQLQMRAVGGLAAKRGSRLRAIPAELTQWASWRARHPDTTVLSPETGHPRDYCRNPYQDYFTTNDLMFPVQPLPPDSSGLRLKELVLGVTVDGRARAYPLSWLKRNGQAGSFDDQLGNSKFRVVYDPRSASARVEPMEGETPAIVYSLWFAWHVMYPHTELWGNSDSAQGTSRATTPASRAH